ALWPLLPQVVALPSPSALREANARLAEQMDQREAAMLALRRETQDRLHAEAMLRQSQKMEALGQLTGGVAHDFNNLLMVVQGNLETLGKHLPDGDPRRRYVERAAQGAARGATLIQQLLAFARRQNLFPSRFDVNERMGEVMELLRGVLDRAIILDWHSEPGLWPVEADAAQLETALLNLAVNARDAMPLGGQLTIGTENIRVSTPIAASDGHVDPGEYVRIRISDTGCGMTPEVRDSAFEPFFTTKPIGKGTGLGLSQVYGFVKQSRGHIGIESEPGRGTTLTIWLPRAVQAALGAVS
ncbi:MAG TPA: ATP-binding protein, partial [Acetobacteraceae bacterium]|nr:ATP-binding protein [Acetobacteraceae bacterium]